MLSRPHSKMCSVFFVCKANSPQFKQFVHLKLRMCVFLVILPTILIPTSSRASGNIAVGIYYIGFVFVTYRWQEHRYKRRCEI